MADDSWDSKAISVSRGRGFGPWYSVMRWIGRRCSSHFFSDVQVIGDVASIPKDGPFLLVCTHFSTIMDVAIISAQLPHNRPIHYWAKKGLYRGRLFAWILNDSGNIQVDRQNKSNQDLFRGTFDAMQAGEAIGLFPEGGSYTEPKLHTVKAGAAWAALEYAKFLAVDEEGNIKSKDIKTDVRIVPASINYTEKSRFRSKAVFHIGQAFSVDEYTHEFLSASSAQTQDAARLGADAAGLLSAPLTPGIGPGGGSHNEGGYLSAASVTSVASMTDEAAPAVREAVKSIGSSAHGVTRRGDRGAKGAVQKLTDRIASELTAITINAPDWRVWHAMKMARDLLFDDDVDVKLLVPLSNALITLFIDDDRTLPLRQSVLAQDALVRLQMLQLAARTDVPTLNAVAPPVTRTNYAIPSLPRIVGNLLYNAVLVLVKAPLYGPLLAFYSPAYFCGWYMSSRYARHEEESMASVKALIGFPVAFVLHAIFFLVVSSLFLFTPPGILIAAGLSIAMRVVTERLVLDDAYRHLKLLGAYSRLLTIQSTGGVGQLKGDEAEVAVMLAAIQDAQPVQHTLTRAFTPPRRGRKGSATANGRGSSRGEATDAADLLASHDGGGNGHVSATTAAMLASTGGQSFTGRKRLRRPAAVRCLSLALKTRRECVVLLLDLVRTVNAKDSSASTRQREAWRYLEANGARLG